MARSLEDMLAQRPGANSPTAANTMLLDPSEEARLRAANPDQAAQAQQLVGNSGLPATFVERNLEDVQKREEVRRFNQFVADVPEARHLGDEWNAVAKDDVETLTNIRDKLSNVGLSAASGWQSFKAGSYGLGEAFGTFMWNEDAEFTDLMRVERQDAERKIELMQPYAPGAGNIEQGIYGGISSLVQTAPGLLVGALTGGAGALPVTISNVWGQSYGEAHDQGLDGTAAARYATEQAAIEYVTEKLPTKFLFGDIAQKSGLLRTLVRQLVTEIPGEQLATLGQDASTWLELNPDKTVDQFMAERPAAAIQTLVATLTGTAIQTTAIHQLMTLEDRSTRAKEQGQVIRELAGLAEASALRERSPEQFKRYVEAIAGNTELYVDAQDADALLQSAVDDLPPDLEARIAESAEADTPIRLTAAEYATYFGDAHTAQNLAPRIRVGSAEAMNQEEAENIESEFKARAEQAIAQADDVEAARADARLVNEQVLNQITSTGRFRPDVAKAYASLVENFFVTMGARSGTTASELFGRYPLRVQATDITDADTLDQPAQMQRRETNRGVEATFTIGDVGYKARLKTPDSIVFKQVATEIADRYGSDQIAMELDFGAGTLEDGPHVEYSGRVDAPNVMQLGSTLVKFAQEELAKVPDRVVFVTAPVDSTDQRLRIYERALRRSLTTHTVERYDDETIVMIPRGQQPQQEETLQQSRLPDTSVVPAAEAQGKKLYDATGDLSKLREQARFATRFTMDEAGNRVPLETQFDTGEFAQLVQKAGFEGYTGGELLAGQAKLVGQKPTQIPVRTVKTVPIGSILASRIALQGAADDTRAERGTRTKGPLQVRQLEDGQLLLVDGYHRYSDAVQRGDDTVEVQVVGYARSEDMAPRAGDEFRVETDTLFQLAPEHEPRGFDLVAPYLTDSEKVNLRRDTAQKLVNLFESLPDDADFEAAAKAGEAKRGWYAQAVNTLRQVFGETDAPRFAALLAATSPQVSVQTNLHNAALIWAKWDEAGRPTDSKAINDIVSDALGGAQSVLGAWRNNTVRALSGENPYEITLSGPKVNSFMRNLMGDVQEVTNDTWMANFAAIQQTVFSGGATKTGPGKRPGYLAYTAKVRRAAERLGWTPAEVQETIWSWAKTAYELADVAGETRSVEQLVRDGAITDERVAGAADFASMLKNNAPIRNILEAAGYGEAINAIEVEFNGERTGADNQRATVTPAILRSARRLDEVRRRRAAEAAGEEVAQGPLAGTLLNIGLNVNDGSKLTEAEVLAKLSELEAKVETAVVHESNTEPTLVVKLTSPLKKAEMDALSEDLRQEAVVQVIDGQGALYGPQAEKWGPYNPEYFLTLDGRRASEVQPSEKTDALEQDARGQIRMGRDMQLQPSIITLMEHADLSTFLHESGHFFLEVMSDLATRPNAAPAITQDMETLLKWMGFNGSISDWRSKSIPERREGHEKFARGFEAWLMEGNAPNEEVRGLFHRFRSWLVNLYRSISQLNVELTPEVRTVMQGMFATEAQIKQAEAARSYLPLFDSAQAAGMTPEEWTAYQDTTRAATEQAEDILQARSMRNLRWLDNARAKEMKKLQAANADKRAAVRAEVEADVAREPIRVAETFILEGKAWTDNLVTGEPEEITIEGPHKLSVASLKEAYGTREEYQQMVEASGVDASAARAPWQLLPRKYLSFNDGMSADEVAELTGFTSGDELVTQLLTLPNRELVVRAETDKRMLERYGDVNNPLTMARAVDMAVHNQHRTRVVATELQALDESLKTQPGGIATVRRAARDFAQKVVQRLKIRDVRPAQYRVAETKAAQDARVALAKGDLKLAATRKRDQLFNGYASRDASRAQEQIEKGMAYLKRFGDNKVRASIEAGYRDQIDKLLERVDLRRRTLREVDKRTSLAEWIKEQEAQGNEPVIPDELVDESRRTNYQNLTVEQFAGLVDSVKNIEHLARLKSKLLAAKEQRDFNVAVDELVTSIETYAPKGKSKVQLERDLSMWGKFADTLNSWFTHLRKMSSVSRQIDGGQDGGKFWSYMMQPLNAAADKEVSMRAAATKSLNTLLDSLPALRKTLAQRVGQKVKGPPKMFVPQVGVSLSLEARLGVALNWGNEGNRERIREGNKWTDEQALAVINTLTKEEMDFVQAAWNYIGSFWDEIAAKEERVTGVRPTRVESTPITTVHGVYQGGYYPIVADPGRSEKAAQQNDAELIGQALRGAVTRATTRRGHTKARVGGKDPVRLDLGVLTQHVGQVIHDLSWHEALIDAGRLLRAPGVSGSLREHYGAEVTRLMRKTLDDVARGEVVAQDAGERLVNHFRVGATVAGLGLSVTTALMQPTGITQSIVRVGARHMAYGLMEFVARPAQSIKRVREASTFMRDRGLVLNRELGEITNRLEGGSKLMNFYFLPIQALQTAVDVPTWLGAYNKAFGAGESEDRAKALADQAVRDAQSSGQLQDLAEVQRGGAYKKLFTNFYSYFSATYQLSAESIQGFKRKPSIGSGIKMGSDFLMLYTVPAVLGLLIREGLRGDLGDDDPEELAEALIKAQLSAILGVYPYFREVGAALGGFEYRGPAGASFLAHVTSLIKQLEQGEVDEPLLRAANRAAGTAFHYPANQVDRTVRGLIAVSEGEAGPQAILVGPPAKKD